MHVPDSDPGCALQSTSMPALHGRNVPNCRPMADGGMRKCSAGACPPLGSAWGVAESAVPIRCTKPQLRLFIPWCAGTSRHERLVRKCALAACECASAPASSFSRKRESRGGVVGGANDTRALSPTSTPNSHTLVCRRQPARAIPMKACPGLRSGISSRPVTPAFAGVQGAGEPCSAGACSHPRAHRQLALPYR